MSHSEEDACDLQRFGSHDAKVYYCLPFSRLLTSSESLSPSPFRKGAGGAGGWRGGGPRSVGSSRRLPSAL